jgi:hypothetical protein
MSRIWLATVPKNKQNAQSVFQAIADSLEAKGQCRVYEFEIPTLVIGTLDSLMALSDDLGKISVQVEVKNLFLNPLLQFSG